MSEWSVDLPIPVPEWANYVAQSSGGTWAFYENKPEESIGNRFTGCGGEELIATYHHVSKPNSDWKNSLKKIERTAPEMIKSIYRLVENRDSLTPISMQAALNDIAGIIEYDYSDKELQ